MIVSKKKNCNKQILNRRKMNRKQLTWTVLFYIFLNFEYSIFLFLSFFCSMIWHSLSHFVLILTAKQKAKTIFATTYLHFIFPTYVWMQLTSFQFRGSKPLFYLFIIISTISLSPPLIYTVPYITIYRYITIYEFIIYYLYSPKVQDLTF